MPQTSRNTVRTPRAVRKSTISIREKRVRDRESYKRNREKILKRLKDKYWADEEFRKQSNRKNKLYRDAHKEELYEKEHQRRHSPEGQLQRKEYSKKRYLEHGDRIRAKGREYYHSNPEERYKKHREWVVANKARAAAWRKEWNRLNPDKVETIRLNHKNKLKKEVIAAYGGVCACCEEDILNFLTIDHIDGGGNAHRRELKNNGGGSFYSYLRKNGWPEGYQVLCFNCNMSKGFLGTCPHQS